MYFGEVRLRLSDVFKDAKSLYRDVQWYQLYLSAHRYEFITGSVLVSYEVFEKGKDPGSGLGVGEPSSTPNVGDASKRAGVSLRLQIVEDLLERVSLGRLSLYAKYQNWLDSLLTPQDTPVANNDQGYYVELPAGVAGGLSDVSDLDSIADQNEEGKEPARQVPRLISLVPHQAKFLYDSASSGSDSDVYKSDYTSGSEVFSVESYAAAASTYSGDAVRREKKKKRCLRKKTKPESRYELWNRSVEGVLFLEIVSCSDLPPIKNFARTTFNMDPFVVVTFRKTTFRTSWKLHNLNPIWNERLAFEILEHELN